MNRIPVCEPCLAAPRAFVPEIFCARCGTPFLSAQRLDEEGLCRLCRTGAVEFEAAYSFGLYEGALRELIHLLKYEGVRELAPRMGEWLAAALPRGQRFDAIVPAPLHWWRKLRRGFNQSALLARELGRRTGLAVEEGLLRRVRATPQQANLPLAGRRKNVAGAFRVARPERAAGKRLLLIDDVYTTGATLNACARALKKAGAAHVSTLTLARVDRRPPRIEFAAAPAPSGHPHAGATA